jgi:integrase
VLAFAVADCRVQHNVAAVVRKPTGGRVRREGRALTIEELRALMEACKGRYRDVVPMLALAGCDGVSWRAFGSVTGYRFLVLACACAAPCWRVAAAVPCTWTR